MNEPEVSRSADVAKFLAEEVLKGKAKMYEPEVNSPADAAQFLAEEVLNEYHAFPVGYKDNLLHIQLNGVWYTLPVRRSNSLDMMGSDLT